MRQTGGVNEDEGGDKGNPEGGNEGFEVEPAGIFRSRDGDEVWGRGPAGYLVPLPPDRRDAWTADERHRVMAAELEKFGLWDHLPAERRASAAAEVASGCYPLDFDVLFEHVEFFADGESLAEFGVERFLGQLAPTLERYGLVLHVETEMSSTPGTGGYVVVINGIRCTVWHQGEWEGGHDMWALSTVRPLAVVNQLLAAAGRSTFRAHTLYAGGNEGLVYLMDPRAAEAIRASGLLPEREVPALAADPDTGPAPDADPDPAG